MGNLESLRKTDEEPFFCFLLDLAESSNILPDISIDKSLIKYSGLNSAAELETSINRMIRQVFYQSPDYLRNLESALSAFDNLPSSVGLGALALSIVLELIIKGLQSGESEDGTVDLIRRVFAEEKASGVRDSMEEYMKRLGMFLHQPTRAIEETERLEKHLSEQLTRLKNSMLHDHHMSSRSMKHWTNGAAFHLQMLIHAARLKMQYTKKQEVKLQDHVTSIVSVLERYQSNLQDLLKEYKAYKKTNTCVFQPSTYKAFMMESIGLTDWAVVDGEVGRQSRTEDYHKEMLGSSDAYVDYMFNNNWSQIKKLNSYFSDLKNNTRELIIQNTEFSMDKVLPY